MPRAIITVTDHTGIVPFANFLVSIGWDIVTDDATAQQCKSHGIPHRTIRTLTGQPQQLHERLTTLHPAIHAGISLLNNKENIDLLLANGYAPVSLVICNYPMASIESTHALHDISIAEDTLLRTAAANYQHVIVLCDPDDYPLVQKEIEMQGAVSAQVRLQLATKALAYARDHATAIHAHLQQKLQTDDAKPLPAPLPDTLSLNLTKRFPLRYGSNPHQQAAYYSTAAPDAPAGSEFLGGQNPTLNGARSLDIAWLTANAFERPALVIAKHRKLIGVASAASVKLALSPALATNREEAEGSVIAVNRPVGRSFVSELSSLYITGIVAPEFTLNALDTLRQTRPNCAIFRAKPDNRQNQRLLTTLYDGYVLQTLDTDDPLTYPWRKVTRWTSASEEIQTLRLAWRCAHYAPSHAIVLAKGSTTVGIGSGQLTRFEAAKLAIVGGGAQCMGAGMASDTIITEPELISLASAVGITAIVQPGGALQDASVIAAADEAGIAMYFTSTRHYR